MSENQIQPDSQENIDQNKENQIQKEEEVQDQIQKEEEVQDQIQEEEDVQDQIQEEEEVQDQIQEEEGIQNQTKEDEKSIQNQNQEKNEEDEEAQKLELSQLNEEIGKLRQETNFDISSSLSSAKNLILDEYSKCIQVATTIFAVYARTNQNQVSVPCYDQEKQTQKFIKNIIHYKTFFTEIFSHPESFAETIFDRILNSKFNTQLFAFEIMPILYSYYIDDTCCQKAQQLLNEIIDLISKNEKISEFEKFAPLFQSFFLGSYKFHDLLWNNFYRLNISSTEDIPVFDQFLSSLQNASLSLDYQLPVLRNLICLSNEDGLEFIVSGILKPSLVIYKNLFSGTDLFEQMLSEFQSISYSPADSKIQSIHKAFFVLTSPIPNSLDVTSIHFENGLPVTMLCSSLAKLIRYFTPDDAIIKPISPFFGQVLKSAGDLEWNSKQTLTIPIFYPHATIKEFNVEKSQDKKASMVWKQIKKSAEEASVDPLTLIPVLNPSCDHISGITETIEFAKFAMNEEMKELKSKKEYLKYIIGLTMTYKSIANIEKTLESITKHAYDTYLHYIMNTTLQIQPNLKGNRISSSFRGVTKNIQKLGLPLEAGWVPSFVTLLDNVTATPSIRKLTKQYQNCSWSFRDKLISEHADDIESIKNELDYLAKIAEVTLKCTCGQQFWKIYELAKSITLLQAICEDNSINLSGFQIFSYIFPKNNGQDFISALIRIYQIAKLFTNNEVNYPKKIYEKINLINSWVIKILQTEKNFDIDLYTREVDKAFS